MIQTVDNWFKEMPLSSSDDAWVAAFVAMNPISVVFRSNLPASQEKTLAAKWTRVAIRDWCEENLTESWQINWNADMIVVGKIQNEADAVLLKMRWGDVAF